MDDFIGCDSLHPHGRTHPRISVALFNAELHDVDEAPTDIPTLLRILCDASEFDELPVRLHGPFLSFPHTLPLPHTARLRQVRHNEEHVNLQLSDALPWRVDERTLDSPHTKANLLLQAHFARAALPMSDYITDTKSVLDQTSRVLQEGSTAPRRLPCVLPDAPRPDCSCVRRWSTSLPTADGCTLRWGSCTCRKCSCRRAPLRECGRSATATSLPLTHPPARRAFWMIRNCKICHI